MMMIFFPSPTSEFKLVLWVYRPSHIFIYFILNGIAFKSGWFECIYCIVSQNDTQWFCDIAIVHLVREKICLKGKISTFIYWDGFVRALNLAFAAVCGTRRTIQKTIVSKLLPERFMNVIDSFWIVFQHLHRIMDSVGRSGPPNSLPATSFYILHNWIDIALWWVFGFKMLAIFAIRYSTKSDTFAAAFERRTVNNSNAKNWNKEIISKGRHEWRLHNVYTGDCELWCWLKCGSFCWWQNHIVHHEQHFTDARWNRLSQHIREIT